MPNSPAYGMDRRQLVAALMKEYDMSEDLATRVASNMAQSGYTKPYQKAIDSVNAANTPAPPSAFSQMRQAAADIASQIGYGSYEPGANDRNLRRIDGPELADIVAQGNAPVPGGGVMPMSIPITPQGGGEIGPVLVNKRPIQHVQQSVMAAQRLAQQLQVVHGLDPVSAMTLAAKLYPIPPHYATELGPRGRN